MAGKWWLTLAPELGEPKVSLRADQPAFLSWSAETDPLEAPWQRVGHQAAAQFVQYG
jgi:hypothetical protein